MSNEQTQMNEKFAVEIGQEFSLALIMFHQSVAEKVGLNLTDYKVLGMIPKNGLTAGEIALKTGLSTGMVTTVVDRLENKNFVYRKRDLKDRRKVIIKVNARKVDSELGPIFQSFGRAMSKVAAAYSPTEYNVILDYIQKSIEVFKQEMKKLKQN